ncbi:sigma-70 family RNA polymerase sigma factor [Singulisphaera sp. PoT]|uniref:sigma-70 family RNA polymerase sigma factor n=1 Tax=Singulisphaera sp. PoT TaxID=3411797 RepID=UPI003BF60CD9
MAGEVTRAVLEQQVEVLFRSGTMAGMSDRRLLERFVARESAEHASEAAFAALVERHGSMVLRSCRRVLKDEHAAQDAAQATFLVLARRARSVVGFESIGGWLHGVAVRVAAKEKVAGLRRRRRERQGGALAEERRASSQGADPGRWEGLDEELGRLPESFRTPLVLCYLEGLTQEQAAAQLGWPIGTVQSRLARGRAKLKTLLIRRGIAPTAALTIANMTGLSAEAAPTSWISATLAAARAFTHRSSWAVKAGAEPAAAGLAQEVLRDMGTTPLKTSLAIMLIATAATVASAFVEPVPETKRATPAKMGAMPPREEPPPHPKATPPIAQADANITVTGIVRDDQGKPLAKVWVGSEPLPSQDTWDNPRPENIRERKEPFRDAGGQVIPPGEAGKYFEVREPNGPWRPVSPDDIRPHEPIVLNMDGHADSKEEVAKTHSPYIVRVARGGWRMANMPGTREAVRTDAEGRFSLTFANRQGGVPAKFHFASSDFALQATLFLSKDFDLKKLLDVRLRPTRIVKGRVVEEPRDDPRASMNFGIYTVEQDVKPWREWLRWILPNSNANDPPHVKRHFEVRLPAGKYKLEFRSETMQRVVDVEVPTGTEPMDVDFRLESLASVRATGGPAMEIDADDLEGHPVKLSDLRGNVVVLDFWGKWCGPCVGAMPRLVELQKRFQGKPLVILALHDGSIRSADEYRKAIAPIKDQFWGGADLPFKVLIDRPQAEKGARSYDYKPGEIGSGQTNSTYEIMSWPSTFVIDPRGHLVGKFAVEALEGILEDQFGLPRSKPEMPAGPSRSEPPDRRHNVRIRGQVVGPDGRPVAGATLLPQEIVVRQKEIKTGADGSFDFMAETLLIDHFPMRVYAEGLASKVFQIEDSNDPRPPLRLGVGAEVTGRVVRDGKPQAGVVVGLLQTQRGSDTFLGFPETKTDAEGRFFFTHVFTDQQFDVAPKTGALADEGAVVPRRFKVEGDGSTVDLGDLEVKPGRKLAGSPSRTARRSREAPRSAPVSIWRSACCNRRSTKKGDSRSRGFPRPSSRSPSGSPTAQRWIRPDTTSRGKSNAGAH